MVGWLTSVYWRGCGVRGMDLLMEGMWGEGYGPAYGGDVG